MLLSDMHMAFRYDQLELCLQLSVWRCRGKVPLAIDITACLTEISIRWVFRPAAASMYRQHYASRPVDFPEHTQLARHDMCSAMSTLWGPAAHTGIRMVNSPTQYLMMLCV